MEAKLWSPDPDLTGGHPECPELCLQRLILPRRVEETPGRYPEVTSARSSHEMKFPLPPLPPDARPLASICAGKSPDPVCLR